MQAASGTSRRRESDSQTDRSGTPFSPVFEDASDVLRNALFNAFTDRQINALLEDSANFSTPTSVPNRAAGESAFYTNTAPFTSANQPWAADGSGSVPVMMENPGHPGTLSPNTAFLELLSAPGGILSQNVMPPMRSGVDPADFSNTRKLSLGAAGSGQQQQQQQRQQVAAPGYPVFYNNANSNNLAAAMAQEAAARNAAQGSGGLPPYGSGSAGQATPTATYMTPYGPVAFTYTAELPPPPPPPLSTQRVQQSATHVLETVNGSGGNDAALPQFVEPHMAGGINWQSTSTTRAHAHQGNAMMMMSGGGGHGNLNASGHAPSFSPLSSVASNVLPSPLHVGHLGHGGRANNTNTNTNTNNSNHHASQPRLQQQQMNMSKSGTAPIPVSPSKSAMNATITEVFDAEFRQVFEVPTSCVAHLPPARLNITRLVLCRNYRAGERDSCAMGANCKFVHADCDYSQLPTHSIHVNYLWREAELCTYSRLPDDRTVPLQLWADSIPVGCDGAVADPSAVAPATGGHHTATSTSTNGAVPAKHSHAGHAANGTYILSLNSGMLLRTAGSVHYVSCSCGMEPLVTCEAYELDGICRQGDGCAFAHRVIVDATTKNTFKRAPRRRHPNCSSTTGHSSVANSPRFGPQAGNAAGVGSATATPTLRPQASHASPHRHTGTNSSEQQCLSGTGSKSGTASVVDGNSGHGTPASSSLGITSASAGAFGLRMEQWVQRAVRVQLLATLPGMTTTTTATGSTSTTTTAAATARRSPLSRGPHDLSASGEDGTLSVIIPAAMASALSCTDAIGTLLYVPRGSDQATVLGPVTAEDVLPSSQ